MNQKSLKSDSKFPKKLFFVWFIESPLKTMKNVFYFILKALFVFKRFKFLPWRFGYIEKMVRLIKAYKLVKNEYEKIK